MCCQKYDTHDTVSLKQLLIYEIVQYSNIIFQQNGVKNLNKHPLLSGTFKMGNMFHHSINI